MSGNAAKPCPRGTAPGPHLTRRELVVGGLAASAMVGGTGIGIAQTAMMSPDRAVRTEFVVNGTA
jgi:hypothetical protein